MTKRLENADLNRRLPEDSGLSCAEKLLGKWRLDGIHLRRKDILSNEISDETIFIGWYFWVKDILRNGIFSERLIQEKKF